MAETCTVEWELVWPDGRVEKKHCKWPIESELRCIGHQKSHTKNVDGMMPLIDDEIQNSAVIDFSHWFFPQTLGGYFKGKHFDKPIAFDGALFARALFSQCEFNDLVLFRGLQIRELADFSNATFRKFANFESVNFQGSVRFENAKFLSGASFKEASLGDQFSFKKAIFFEKQNANLEFTRKERIGTDITFSQTQFLCPSIIDFSKGVTEFKGADLSGLLFSFLNFEKTKFEEIEEWPEQIIDEKLIKHRQEVSGHSINPLNVVKAYKFLERYFLKHMDYARADRAYVRHMICQRYSPGLSRSKKFLNWLHQLISSYDTSLLKSILWFLLIGFLFSFVLTLMKVKIPLGEGVVSADLTVPDFFRVLLTYLPFSSIPKLADPKLAVSIGSGLLILLEHILLAALTPMIYNASKRQFSSKKPFSED